MDEFSRNLNDSILNIKLRNVKGLKFLTDQNIKSFIKQNNYLEGVLIAKYYINRKVHFSSSFRDTSLYKYSILFSAPLFTLDKRNFIISTLLIIKDKNLPNLQWNETFIVFGLKNGNWYRHGFIREKLNYRRH